MRAGVRLGVDVGTVRIGVAACDAGGVLATPVETVARGRGDLDRLVALAAERDVVEVLVGLPRHLSGAEGASAADARGLARRLAQRLDPVAVRMVDERLSTVAAERGLRAAGISGARGRTVKRAVLDQAAAVVILQSALDAERGSGRPPGDVVSVRRPGATTTMTTTSTRTPTRTSTRAPTGTTGTPLTTGPGEV